jgi:hypothetical protein
VRRRVVSFACLGRGAQCLELVLLARIVIRFFIVVVMMLILTLLSGGNVWLRRALSQIEGCPLCNVDDRFQGRPGLASQ